MFPLFVIFCFCAVIAHGQEECIDPCTWIEGCECTSCNEDICTGMTDAIVCSAIPMCDWTMVGGGSCGCSCDPSACRSLTEEECLLDAECSYVEECDCPLCATQCPPLRGPLCDANAGCVWYLGKCNCLGDCLETDCNSCDDAACATECFWHEEAGGFCSCHEDCTEAACSAVASASSCDKPCLWDISLDVCTCTPTLTCIESICEEATSEDECVNFPTLTSTEGVDADLRAACHWNPVSQICSCDEATTCMECLGIVDEGECQEPCNWTVSCHCGFCEPSLCFGGAQTCGSFPGCQWLPSCVCASCSPLICAVIPSESICDNDDVCGWKPAECQCDVCIDAVHCSQHASDTECDADTLCEWTLTDNSCQCKECSSSDCNVHSSGAECDSADTRCIWSAGTCACLDCDDSLDCMPHDSTECLNYPTCEMSELCQCPPCDEETCSAESIATSCEAVQGCEFAEGCGCCDVQCASLPMPICTEAPGCHWYLGACACLQDCLEADCNSLGQESCELDSCFWHELPSGQKFCSCQEVCSETLCNGVGSASSCDTPCQWDIQDSLCTCLPSPVCDESTCELQTSEEECPPPHGQPPTTPVELCYWNPDEGKCTCEKCDEESCRKLGAEHGCAYDENCNWSGSQSRCTCQHVCVNENCVKLEIEVDCEGSTMGCEWWSGEATCVCVAPQTSDCKESHCAQLEIADCLETVGCNLLSNAQCSCLTNESFEAACASHKSKKACETEPLFDCVWNLAEGSYDAQCTDVPRGTCRETSCAAQAGQEDCEDNMTGHPDQCVWQASTCTCGAQNLSVAFATIAICIASLFLS